MPQLGLTMTEGSVNTWLMKPGDTVHKGEMLFVVSTDKADMEIESMDEGTLSEIVVQPGNVVPVGTVIAYLVRPGDELRNGRTPPSAVAETQPAVTAEKETAVRAGEQAPVATGEPVRKAEGVRVSPRARRLALQLGVDLSQVAGSGDGGVIVEEDVRRAQKAASAPAPVAPSVSEELRRRQLIAEKLTISIQTIPHFAVAAEVNAKELMALRQSLQGVVQQQSNVKLTMTDLLLKALGLAMEETPQMKAVWENGTLRAYTGCDLGLAIATEKGVVAPVIRGADSLTLASVGQWRTQATEKARSGRLALKDLEGGIGTLSNLGMYRVDLFQALITPGQSFVLAAGKIDNRPWVDKGVLTVAPTLRLNLSVDHRVADGALAAQFLGKIAELIENPYRLIWEPKKSI
jgi:pyruvate dehydrogenase E2 component (dihydrolipoamide acetyltransferase)